MDSELFTIGIFDSLDLAKEQVTRLYAAKNKPYQINRIPINTIGSYGEVFDVVWSVA